MVRSALFVLMYIGRLHKYIAIFTVVSIPGKFEREKVECLVNSFADFLFIYFFNLKMKTVIGKQTLEKQFKNNSGT